MRLCVRGLGRKSGSSFLIHSISSLLKNPCVISIPSSHSCLKLTFGSLSPAAKAIYCESSLTGEEGIAVNTTDTESRLDLELLFAAVSRDRTAIPAILNANHNRHE